MASAAASGVGSSHHHAISAFHHWRNFARVRREVHELGNVILYALSSEIEQQKERFSSWYDSKWVKWVINGCYSVACAIPFTDFIENGVIPVKYSSALSVGSILIGAKVQKLKDAFDKRIKEREKLDEELDGVKNLCDTIILLQDRSKRTDARIGRLYQLFKDLPEKYWEKITSVTNLGEKEVYRLILIDMPDESPLKKQFLLETGAPTTCRADEKDDFIRLVNSAAKATVDDVPTPSPVIPKREEKRFSMSGVMEYMRSPQANATPPQGETAAAHDEEEGIDITEEAVQNWDKWAQQRKERREKEKAKQLKAQAESLHIVLPPITNVRELGRTIYSTLSTEVEYKEKLESKWYDSVWGTRAVNFCYAIACALPVSDLIERGIVPNKYSSLLSVGAVLVALRIQQLKEQLDEKRESIEEERENLEKVQTLCATIAYLEDPTKRTDARVGKLFQQFDDLPDRFKTKIFKVTGLNQIAINRLVVSEMCDNTDLKREYLEAEGALNRLRAARAEQEKEAVARPIPAMLSSSRRESLSSSLEAEVDDDVDPIPPIPVDEVAPTPSMWDLLCCGKRVNKEVIPMSPLRAEEAPPIEPIRVEPEVEPEEVKQIREALGDLYLFDFEEYYNT